MIYHTRYIPGTRYNSCDHWLFRLQETAGSAASCTLGYVKSKKWCTWDHNFTFFRFLHPRANIEDVFGLIFDIIDRIGYRIEGFDTQPVYRNIEISIFRYISIERLLPPVLSHPRVFYADCRYYLIVCCCTERNKRYIKYRNGIDFFCYRDRIYRTGFSFDIQHDMM